ncbi:hypothetical protein QYE76_005041 [Lolium multiflorum]|uniref:N-acetyl-gamma-glutamyl-phosphate reductase dimerisation domain-containing protein n=1 Tax=Lolium multiflorum TaxID=4521 RepID=A0AAD8RRV3_LOLMU|nr:hypothetical protein QYE76_005041 [Lolium multiflorum]
MRWKVMHFELRDDKERRLLAELRRLIGMTQAKLIKLSSIIIDAKSVVTGAGRRAKEANIYTEIDKGIHAYGIKGFTPCLFRDNSWFDRDNSCMILHLVIMYLHLSDIPTNILQRSFIEASDGFSRSSGNEPHLIIYCIYKGVGCSFWCVSCRRL